MLVAEYRLSLDAGSEQAAEAVADAEAEAVTEDPEETPAACIAPVS